MLTKEQIKHLLSDRQLNKVAELAGVAEITIYRFVKTNKASYDTLKKLSDYLEGQYNDIKQ